jgi:hypothetical protein
MRTHKFFPVDDIKGRGGLNPLIFKHCYGEVTSVKHRQNDASLKQAPASSE